MDNWPQWRDKIIEMGNAESSTRPNIKKILGNMKDSENNDKEGTYVNNHHCMQHGRFINICVSYIEHQDAYSLELLCKLLYPRGFGKNVIFIKNYEVSE